MKNRKKTRIFPALVLLIAVSLLCAFLFGGCNCSDYDEYLEDSRKAETMLSSIAERESQKTDESEKEASAADVQEETTTAAAAVSPDEIQIESAEYTGEGTGGAAVYEFKVIIPAELVKKGWSLGDVWAKIGNKKPTFDDWDGINTYPPGEGKEEELADGSKRITWRTAVYFPEDKPQPEEGQEVTLGVNAAGQDADGNWSEGEITGTITVKWGKK